MSDYEIHLPNTNGMHVVSVDGLHIGGVKPNGLGGWAALACEPPIRA